MKKFIKIFLAFLTIGFALMVFYQFAIVFESPFGFMTPNTKVTLFDEKVLKNGESFSQIVKTTQGYYHVVTIVTEISKCPKVEIFDESGNFVQEPQVNLCIFDLSKLEKESTYHLKISNPGYGDFELYALYLYDTRISWFSDYLPRHGIFLDLIGFSLMLVGIIVFAIGKIKSRSITYKS